MKTFLEDTHFAAAQYLGDRDQQQDSCRFVSYGDRKSLVANLADGMGGYEGGKVASETVISSFLTQLSALDKSGKNQGDTIEMTRRLAKFTVEANRALKRKIERSPKEMVGMGTTFLSVFINQNEFGFTSVGDSPLLHWDAQRQLLNRLNDDHSMMEEIYMKLIRSEWSEEQKRNLLAQRSTLRSALIGEPIRIQQTRAPFKAKPGDILVLGSDGLLSLEHHRIAEILRKHQRESAVSICSKMTSRIEEKRIKGQDNATVMVVVFP